MILHINSMVFKNDSTIMKYKLDFYTEYNQFYLSDKASPKNTNSTGFWTPEAHEDRLAIEKGVVGIGTESYGHIKADISILDIANNLIDTIQYDHIVEGGIEIESGELQVLDCPTSVINLEIKLKPGKYRVRVYSLNLASADIDEDEGDDYYKIEIWPDTNMERKVLKRYIRK
jgi:hypothetical protein